MQITPERMSTFRAENADDFAYPVIVFLTEVGLSAEVKDESKGVHTAPGRLFHRYGRRPRNFSSPDAKFWGRLRKRH